MKAAHFSSFDWMIIAAFLVGTTVLGHLLRGRGNRMEDFFAGGRNVPWWAVSGSLIATSTSALTFISVPAIVFREGGNLTFFQISLGFILGNILLAHTLLKSIYAKNYYSPYDFVEDRLGIKTAHLTRGFFLVGAVMGQGVRLLSTALVLSVVTGLSLSQCILIIGGFAVAWTWMGGITTVIWTDVIQLFVFLLGGVFILFNLWGWFPGGIRELILLADAHAKLTLLDLSTDPTKIYTLWVGIIGTTAFEFSQKSIDQVVAQRLFCCRSLRDAQKALYGASAGTVIVWMMLAVGIGLFGYFQVNPLPLEIAEEMAQTPDRIMPYYIISHLPSGLSGLLVAALFAAGISTLDSALSALTQTVTVDYYRRYWIKGRPEKHYLKMSRAFVLGWGIILSGLALFFESYKGMGLLNLGLAVPGYVYGVILGITLLACLQKGRFQSILIGSVLSVACVFLLKYFSVAFFWWYPVAAVVLIGYTLGHEFFHKRLSLG